MSEKKDLTIHLGQSAQVPAEIAEKAQGFVDNYVAFLKDRTDAYKHRMAEAQVRAKAQPEAAPFFAGGYQYANCLTAGPIQFFGNPPYRPSKIIAAGEETLMLGVVWVNPANGPGGTWPGTVVLGGRPYRVRFETINLSDVTNGPDWQPDPPIGTFDSPANELYIFGWWHTWADPGAHPNLYETTFTLDITEAGQPFAAFSTWHYDPDTEPGFLGIGTVGPHWQFERPARFLVYRKD